MRKRTTAAALLGLLATVAGCSSAPEVRKTPDWANEKGSSSSAEWVREERLPPRLQLSRAPTYAERVQHAVRERGKDLQRCYREELEHDPALHGELAIRLRTGTAGRVEEAGIDFSSLSSPALEPCILDVFRSLELPPAPKDGFTIRYPLVFTSRRTPAEVVDTLVQRYRLQRETPDEKAARQKKKDDYEAPW